MTPPVWLDPKNEYLLGISGGRDSVFLTHWLNQLGYQNLTLCHLNHQLRGEDADRDHTFCRSLAKQLGYRFLEDSRDVAGLAKIQQISLETAARQARHEFLADCARKRQCHRILLAHHAEDQAETILFRLLRGSAGLKGMLPQTEIQINGLPLKILRPILEIRRQQIDHFLAQNQRSYCDDHTNKEPFAVRNRIRNEVLPLLSDILSRDPVPQLVRAEQHDRELQDFLQSQVAGTKPLDPQGRLHLPTLTTLPRAMQRQILHHYLSENEIPDLSWDLISRALQLLKTDSPPTLALPGGLRLRRRQSRIFISP